MGALNSDHERAERLAQLGAQLRQVRKENALTLDHVAAKTMIQARQLQAIEDGNLRDLPEPVYIQGLLKRYADALGLNGAEFARTFPAISAELTVITEPAKAPVPPRLRPIHLYLLYIAVIAAAVGGLSLMFRGNSGTVVAPSPSPSPVAASPSPTPTPQASAPVPVVQSPNPTPVANPSPSPSPAAVISPVAPSPASSSGVAVSPSPVTSPTPNPVASATPPATPGQVRAGVTLRQASWIEVRVDGKVVYEGILPAGTKQTWTAKSKLELSAGNAGGVMVSVNDAPPKPLGQPGAVETATYQASAPAGITPQ